jgi:hypothetical protein
MTSVRFGRKLVTTASLLAAVSLSLPAAADEKQACVAASEKAQQLRSLGKLGEARAQLHVCNRIECPKLIQQDCTQWMSEVLANMPSVVPGAKDRKGRDVVDVRLTIDGKLATEKLDGKPIVLDPGVHAFLFETKGAPSIKEQVVIKPGEKNRIVSVTIASPEESTGGASSEGGARPLSADSPTSLPIAAYAVGGLGIVAGAVALVIDLGASSDARSLRETCAPRCNQSDVDSVQSKYTIAGVTAAFGGALLITGVVLFILHGNDNGSKSGKGGTSFGTPLEALTHGSTAVLRF